MKLEKYIKIFIAFSFIISLCFNALYYENKAREKFYQQHRTYDKPKNLDFMYLVPNEVKNHLEWNRFYTGFLIAVIHTIIGILLIYVVRKIFT